MSGTTRGKVKITEQEWAYAAGMIDGDGHIGVWRQTPREECRWATPRYYVDVDVVNTCYPLMEWLQSHFGGTIRGRKTISDRHTKSWHWRLPKSLILEFLQGIRPYLIVKTAQADLALQFLEEWVDARALPGKRVPPELLERRDWFWQEFRKLNKGGLYHPQRLIEAKPPQ